jgi:cytochrome c-type biogenesis protein
LPLEIAGIFGAGALTLLTPCVLPLVPVYLALLLGPSTGKQRGLFLFFSTAAFSLGLIGVFVARGLTASWLSSAG